MKADTVAPLSLSCTIYSLVPASRSVEAIESWDLELTSVASDFKKDSGSEITLQYNVGKNRTYEVFMLNEDCSTDITPTDLVNFTDSTSDIAGDTSNDNLQVDVDIVKGDIANSTIWVDGKVKMCAKVQLKSGANVIKELERIIEVELNFENSFDTIDNATFAAISLDTNTTNADVDNYIKACTCDGYSSSFVCNTNVLGVDDYLNVCVESLNPEMEIDYLDSLTMDQADTGTTLSIVSNKVLVDGSISSKTTRADDSGVHVASVIPASFFSYASSGTAEVSGVVFLKLKGSSRRLAVEIDDRALQAASDQESAFSMEVQLENELDVIADSNGVLYDVMSGAINGVTVVVTAATFLMW